MVRSSASREADHRHRRSPLSIGDVVIDLRGCAFRVESLADCPSGDASRFAVTLCQIRIDTEINRQKAGLTRRQRQIAVLLANRATNAEIAAALGISAHTARHHSQRVLEKLGVGSRHLVRSRLVTLNSDATSPGNSRSDTDGRTARARK